MRTYIFSLILVVVLLPTLACGALGIGGDSETVEVEPAAPAEEEAAAEPAEPDEASAAQTEAENAAEEAVTESSEAEVEEATEPEAEMLEGEADQEMEMEAEEIEGSAGAATSSESEVVNLTDVSGLEDLASYQVLFTMEFDGTSGGQSSVGQANILLESTEDPSAKHMRLEVSGTTADAVGGENITEFYDVDGTTYLYNNAVGDSWISMPSTDDETFSSGFFSPDEDLELPESASCDLLPETINGISARHCTFSEIDISDAPDATYGSVDGEVWLAVDGGYVVKYTVNITDFEPGAAEQAGMFEFGDIAMNYELVSANDPELVITLPEEAAGAEGLDLGDLGMDSGSTEMPVLEDAEEMTSLAGFTSYVTDSSVSDTIAFYRDELKALGWQELADDFFEAESTAFLSFENEAGSSLMLTITEEDGQVNVSILKSDAQ